MTRHSHTASEQIFRTPFLFGEHDDWVQVRDGNTMLRPMLNRHYSARHYRDNRQPAKVIGPGEYIALITYDASAIFCWRKAIMMDGQLGVNCSIFRNEGTLRSSDLIGQAMIRAWDKWPGERLFTYVNPSKIASSNPGYCFICAGWRRCGRTKKGLVILEATS